MPRPEQTPEVQVTRGEAEDIASPQLPMGATQVVQEGLDEAERLQAETEATQPQAAPAVPQGEDRTSPEGVRLGGTRPRERLVDDDEVFLYGPTGRPTEPLSAGARLGHKAPPTEEIMGWLPYLTDAATQPNAPQELRDLLREIVYSLGG